MSPLGPPLNVRTGGRSDRVLRKVYASTSLWMASYALVTVTLPFRFEALGLSVLQYGTVLAVNALGMLATEGLWGLVAFRIGRPRVILSLGTGLTVVLFALGFDRSFFEFAATYGLVGVLFIFPIPLSRWLSLTARGPGTGGAGTGRYGLFFGVGLVAGTAVGPLAFVGYGYLPVAVAAVLISVVATLLLASAPWTAVALPERRPSAPRQVREIFQRHFTLCAALVTVYFVAYCLSVNFLQYYSVALFGGTPTAAGYVIGAARAVTLTSGFLLGPTIDRWGPSRAAPIGFLTVAFGALATLASTDYTEMVAATILFSTGTGLLSATLLPLALAPVPSESQGTAVGIFGSFEDLGLLLGPILIGGVYSGYGARSVFPLVAGVAVGGALLAALVRRSGSSVSDTRRKPPPLNGP